MHRKVAPDGCGTEPSGGELLGAIRSVVLRSARVGDDVEDLVQDVWLVMHSLDRESILDVEAFL